MATCLASVPSTSPACTGPVHALAMKKSCAVELVHAARRICVSAIHVMHVINQLTAFAGAEVSLRDIIHGTSAVGIRHTVVVLKADEHSTATDVGDAPVVAPARTLRTRSARVRHVARAIRTYRPDLIHTSLFEADLAG